MSENFTGPFNVAHVHLAHSKISDEIWNLQAVIRVKVPHAEDTLDVMVKNVIEELEHANNRRTKEAENQAPDDASKAKGKHDPEEPEINRLVRYSANYSHISPLENLMGFCHSAAVPKQYVC